MPEDSALLDVRNLTKSFAGIVAAQDVNVAIRAGESVAVIGANGAGKTTFINMVSGWIRPDSGKILFRNADLAGRPPREIARAGLARSFQVSQTFGSLSVRENLMLALAISRGSALALMRPFQRAELLAETEEIARDFALAESLPTRASELSQGTRKLLDIAMAAAGRPHMLLLDEPTSGVSNQEKASLMELVVGSLRRTGTTLVFVEHDMDIVVGFAERVLAFVGGRVVCDDTPERTFADPVVRQHVGIHSAVAAAGAT